MSIEAPFFGSDLVRVGIHTLDMNSHASGLNSARFLVAQCFEVEGDLQQTAIISIKGS